ncbi:MAG TPA: DUF4019 domain-containing protein [Pyrinomonadaceae bacterium]|nr:DUF4019 domain-containing protein [Pyrinomonadaceae bacterium]
MSTRCCGVALGALILFSCVLGASACGVEERQSRLPTGAQAAIDDITNDMSRADYEKIYRDAAEEWRQTARADESRASLERIRERLGSVLSRAQLAAQQRESSGGDANTPQGRTLVVSYNTKFERADAIETFTLVERSGRWLLARYAVNSNALKQ